MQEHVCVTVQVDSVGQVVKVSDILGAQTNPIEHNKF